MLLSSGSCVEQGRTAGGRAAGGGRTGGGRVEILMQILRILSCSEMLLSTGVALEADAAEYSALEQYAHGVNFLTNPNASPTNQAMQSMCPRTADAFRPARICDPAAPAIKNKMMQQTAPQSEVRRTHLSRLSPSARGPREIGSPPHCRIGRGRGCAQEPAEALWRRSHPERHCQRIVYIMPPMPHLCAATHSACRRCRRRARPPLRAQLSSVSPLRRLGLHADRV